LSVKQTEDVPMPAASPVPRPTPAAARTKRPKESPPAAKARTRPLLIAVASGKGGVGKSNLAVNLATTLHREGVATTLVDLDLGLANADVLFGVQPDCDIRDVLGRRRPLGEAVVRTPAGPHLLAGVSGWDGLGRLDATARSGLIEQLADLPGAVGILDCAAGIGDSVTAFARAADIVLVVTTAEPTARADAYALIKTLVRDGYPGSIRLLVNGVHSRQEARAVQIRLQSVCENFLKYPIADAGYLLHDDHVELAVRQRVPFVLRYPRCAASMCVAAIAARLVNIRSCRPAGGGWLARVAGMFT
jgi:flagellar biosynthesis protein FlhG